MNLTAFFNPQSVAVIGVSQTETKLGSIIFQNILDSNFSQKLYAVNPRLNTPQFKGKPVFDSVKSIPHSVDLAVIVVPSKFVESVVEDCIQNKTKNIIIISAGFREVGNRETEDRIIARCTEHNIQVLGPNCLGLILPHVQLNASFSDGMPTKGSIAFISQSGAFCTSALDWAQEKNIGFSHFISLGNKAGISEIELIETLAKDPNVEIFALYLESIKDGQKLLQLIKTISPTKPVIILEPGESKAAQKASSSHTGALAPNAVVVQSAFKEAGAIQVFSMREMFGLLEMFVLNRSKKFGTKTAVITNAGGVGVLVSDLIESSNLQLEPLNKNTLQVLQQVLPAEAGLNNPIDIIGDAPAQRYEDSLQAIANDKNIEQILVLLTPQRTTEIQKTAEIIAKISKTTNQNIVPCFIGGQKTSKGIQIFQDYKIPCFSFPKDAVSIMSFATRFFKESSKTTTKITPSTKRDQAIVSIINATKQQQFTSLPETTVRTLLQTYNIDTPRAKNFVDQTQAKAFAQSFFPNKVVLKISSPNAVHKTELKGIFLNIDSTEKFTKAWNNLNNAIQVYHLPEASIQIQEQINQGTETILGVHADPNFGKFMVFGSGGIYAEVFHDTSLRIIPTNDFSRLINETKIGKILNGVRGQAPKNIKKLTTLLANIQQLVIDYPEIKSIDANPIIVTENRAIAVDVKLYL